LILNDVDDGGFEGSLILFVNYNLIIALLQNNNRGGYNVGDRTDKKAGNNKANQYQMVRHY